MEEEGSKVARILLGRLGSEGDIHFLLFDGREQIPHLTGLEEEQMDIRDPSHLEDIPLVERGLERGHLRRGLALLVKMPHKKEHKKMELRGAESNFAHMVH